MSGAGRPVSFAGVIFDMDGVLCHSEQFICEAACRMFAQTYGLTVAPDDFTPFVGAGENRYLGGVAARYGVTLDIERDKARTYEIYLQIIRGRLQPVAGARDFVLWCRQRGLRTAVATSADAVKMNGNLVELGLSPETFTACVTGSDVARKKPYPDIFELAARRIGLEPSQCLVVEDAPNGLQAAAAAGCGRLGLTTSFSPDELRQAGAMWLAPDLASVPSELLARLGR
jgi:HAD superfamily hydrolase (TIGR01509 family)